MNLEDMATQRDINRYGRIWELATSQGHVKCFIFLSSFVFLCYISNPFLTSFTDQMMVLFLTVPLPPSPTHPTPPILFCPICCILQNGFLLQETSSTKIQSVSLPHRVMFSAIHNSSSTLPPTSALTRNRSEADFIGLFNRCRLVNSP